MSVAVIKGDGCAEMIYWGARGARRLTVTDESAEVEAPEGTELECDYRGGGVLRLRGALGGRAVLLAAGGVVLCPPGDRARDENMLDGALKVGRANILLAQPREPLADLFPIPLGGSLMPAHTLSKLRQLVKFFLHVVVHAFIVMGIAVAMQGHDPHSLARRDSR